MIFQVDVVGEGGTRSDEATGREGTRSGEATGREGRRSGEATINPLRLWVSLRTGETSRGLVSDQSLDYALWLLDRSHSLPSYGDVLMSLVVRGRGESRKEWRGCEVVMVVKLLIGGDGGRKKV
ncbi:hypothetical protein ACFE04_006084 [Oxalis oulophora]